MIHVYDCISYAGAPAALERYCGGLQYKVYIKGLPIDASRRTRQLRRGTEKTVMNWNINSFDSSSHLWPIPSNSHKPIAKFKCTVAHLQSWSRRKSWLLWRWAPVRSLPLQTTAPIQIWCRTPHSRQGHSLHGIICL